MMYLITMISGRCHEVFLPQTGSLYPLSNEMMQIRLELDTPGSHSLQIFSTESSMLTANKIALNIDHIESMVPIIQ